MCPTSVSCQKKGKGGQKAEIKSNWALYVFKGDQDWKPGKPENWHKWKKNSHILLKGRGGAKLRCVSYVKK